MPSRVGCALERRELRKQFDDLAILFVRFNSLVDGDGDVIPILEIILKALEDCHAELEEAESYWTYQSPVGNISRTIDAFNDEWLRQHCRFKGSEIREIMRILEVPSTIRVRGTGRVFTGEEGMLLLLRRLASLENLHHLTATFDRSTSAMSELHNAMLDHVYPFAKRALRMEVWENHLPRLARALAAKGCLIPTCCGFIDGTLFKIRRPTENEDAAYSGWKRMHATKYQAIVLCNFMIADFDGPHAGSTSDGSMLRRSNIEERLHDINRRLGESITIYGDAAYRLTSVLQRPFRGTTTPHQRVFNEKMSSFRQAVEWSFGKLEQLWPFVGDKTRRTIMLRQTGKEDVIAALLTNFHTCLCGGVTTDYLGIAPPTLEEYAAMIMQNDNARTRNDISRVETQTSNRVPSQH